MLLKQGRKAGESSIGCFGQAAVNEGIATASKSNQR